jgi:cobalt-zinc-cadmium efflux system membrane fusion protein
VPVVEGGDIVYSEAFGARVGIDFTPANAEEFRPTFRLTGTVAVDPAHVAVLGTRVRGTVRRVLKVEGDRVRAGEALGEIESPEVGEAQALVRQATSALVVAEANHARERDLLAKSLTTAREAELARAEVAARQADVLAAEQRLRAFGGGDRFGVFVIRSPIDGHLIKSSLSAGQSVDAAQSGFTVADLDYLWVELSVYEHQLEQLSVGDAVRVETSGARVGAVEGSIAHIGEIIDPMTRSADVRVAVHRPAVKLRPGQAVTATLTATGNGRRSILIPKAATTFVDGKATVFVRVAPSRVRVVPVDLGASDGERVEVVRGLAPGQPVAVAGVFALKSELFR